MRALAVERPNPRFEAPVAEPARTDRSRGTRPCALSVRRNGAPFARAPREPSSLTHAHGHGRSPDPPPTPPGARLRATRPDASSMEIPTPASRSVSASLRLEPSRRKVRALSTRGRASCRRPLDGQRRWTGGGGTTLARRTRTRTGRGTTCAARSGHPGILARPPRTLTATAFMWRRHRRFEQLLVQAAGARSLDVR